MAYQEVFRVDTRELIRLWQKGLSQRRIAKISGRARDTVRRYVNLAQELGLQPGGPDPTDDQLAKLTALNLSTPTQVITGRRHPSTHTEQIKQWLDKDKLQLTRIHELLSSAASQSPTRRCAGSATATDLEPNAISQPGIHRGQLWPRNWSPPKVFNKTRGAIGYSRPADPTTFATSKAPRIPWLPGRMKLLKAIVLIVNSGRGGVRGVQEKGEDRSSAPTAVHSDRSPIDRR